MAGYYYPGVSDAASCKVTLFDVMAIFAALMPGASIDTL